jgi:hypothetical protein
VTDGKKYPWLRLLELELAEPRPEMKKKRGRPRSPFPRVRMYSSMTGDEVAALDDLVDLVRTRFGRQVHRGHIIAFMTFQLKNKLQGEGRKMELPEEVKSFVGLVEYLDRL